MTEYRPKDTMWDDPDAYPDERLLIESSGTCTKEDWCILINGHRGKHNAGFRHCVDCISSDVMLGELRCEPCKTKYFRRTGHN